MNKDTGYGERIYKTVDNGNGNEERLYKTENEDKKKEESINEILVKKMDAKSSQNICTKKKAIGGYARTEKKKEKEKL